MALCSSKNAAESAAPVKQFREGAETLPFQAEVNRMMDILINSLYSNKDIFLRELISNAADALDKIRFISLTEKDALKGGSDLTIKIWADPAKNVISIRDTGVGMTRDDLVANLGTIAKSGTSAFVEQMQKGGDLNLIGQFGVGFYSVYLVADYVEVITKHNNDTQWVWESTAGGNFAISPDTDGEPLGRGTQINIHLKPAQKQYSDTAKLKELVERYSEFINFPISLHMEKEVVTEEEEEPAEKPEKKEGDADADAAVEEEAEESEKPKKKKVTEMVKDWVVLNAAQAVWLRSPSDISEEEYAKFYQALAKNDNDRPLTHAHFRAEGDVEFRAIMYVPPHAPAGMYEQYHSRGARMRLYVRRVFISDSFEELLPKWLNFLVGLVDSDTMPLNVSREVLQLDDGLKVIRKKLVRKALDMLRKLSDTHRDLRRKLDSIPVDLKNPEYTNGVLAVGPYENFWKSFAKAVKMGIIEEKGHRRRMLPLLRFHSTHAKDTLTNLEDYVLRMPKDQKAIYYLIGLSKAEVQASPFAEALTARGFEVIYLTDAIDEYMMGHINEFEGHDLINVSKDDLRLSDDADAKKAEKERRKAFRPLTKWWYKLLKGDDSVIEAVKVSQRLAERPCVVVSSKFGWSAQMERISMAQALSDTNGPTAANLKWLRGSRTLEINPEHVVIKELKRRVEANPEDADTVEAAHLLFESCAMESGFVVDDIKTFNKRLMRFVEEGLAKEMLDVPVKKASESQDDKEADSKDEEADEPAEAAEADEALDGEFGESYEFDLSKMESENADEDDTKDEL